MEYKVSKEGIILIHHFESCSLRPYQKKGDRPTIGWGNTFYEHGTPVKMTDKIITQERADKLFYNILSGFEKDVNYLIKPAEKPLTQGMYNGILAFAYNAGTDIDADAIPEGLGDSTLLKKVLANCEDFVAIEKEFMKWISKGSAFEKGLTRRRKSEFYMYKTGKLRFFLD